MCKQLYRQYSQSQKLFVRKMTKTEITKRVTSNSSSTYCCVTIAPYTNIAYKPRPSIYVTT